MPAELYLIPVTLGNSELHDVLPERSLSILDKLTHFAVEDLRSARRYMRKAGFTASFDDVSMYILNEHSGEEDIQEMILAMKEGHSMGIITEAGVPSVADPGAKLVQAAHSLGVRVIPLVGPSSILLALMASGMNGQSFRFHGYLPVKSPQRIKSIKELEREAMAEGVTQIFMETPYRNNKLIKEILVSCRDETRLCLAADISLGTEFIQTKTVREWKGKEPDLHKRPCIFLLNRML